MRRIGLAVVALLVLSAPPPAAVAAVAIEGRALLAGGAPAAGAKVELFPDPPPPPGAEAARPTASTSVDSDGWFVLAAPAPGMWRVRVAASGHVPLEASLRPLVEELVLPEAELPADAGLTVEVRGGGRPVVGAWVLATVEDDGVEKVVRLREAPWRRAGRLAHTGDDGSARLPRAIGERLAVQVYAPGWAPAAALAQVQSAAESLPVELVAGSEVLLRVRDPWGRVARGVDLLLGSARWWAGRTDHGGRARLRLRAASAATGVELLAPDGAYARAELGASTAPGAGRRVSLRLTPARLVRGQVVVAESGEPVAEAVVWSEAEPEAFVLTDSRGGYEMWLTEPMPTLLHAQARGHALDARHLEREAEPPTLALWPAASLEGEVVEAGGRPIGGARVEATSTAGGFPRRRGLGGSRWAYSNRRGAFRLAPLVGGAAYQIVAEKQGFAPAVANAPTGGTGVAEHVRLVLDSGWWVHGRLVGESGEPVAGGDIGVVPERFPDDLRWSGPRGLPTRAVSGEDGAFVVEHLAPGRLRLVARTPAFTILERVFELASGAGLELGDLLLEPGVAVEGRVVDADGRALPGAEVEVADNRLWVVFGGDEPPRTVAESDGRFEIPHRRPGERLHVTASLAGHTSGSATITVPPAAPPVLVLARLTSVSGRVVDGAGRPVPAAQVSWSENLGASPQRQRAASDEQGRFVLRDVPPRTVWITAVAPGWRAAQLSITIPAPGLEDVELRLEPGAAISGRVLESEDRPVVDAQVSARGVGNRSPDPGLTDRSDGEGRYRLEGVAPGLTMVEATVGTALRSQAELRAEAGENRLDLRLPPSHSVAGVVLDADGGPVPGAVVLLADRMPVGRAVSDAEGAFLMEDVPDGHYIATAEAPSRGMGEVAVDIAGSPVAGVELRLERPAVIYGRVVGARPEELLEARVLAHFFGRSSRFVPVDGEGGYRLRDLAPGRWTVSALLGDSHSGRSEVVVAAGEERELDLEVARGFTLSGRVMRDGLPVSGAQVTLRNLREGGGSSTRGRGGSAEFRYTGLEPGRYLVSARAEGGLGELEILLDGDRDVELELGPGARIGGRVVAADAQPLAGAMVTLEATTGGDTDPIPRTDLLDGAPTDSNGSFRIDGLRPGVYRLRAQRPGYAPAEREVAVAAGEEILDLVLELEPSEGLALEIVDATGSPVTFAAVTLLGDAGVGDLSVTIALDAQGRAVLGAAAPGTWTLAVRASATGTARARVTVPGPRVRVQLPPESRLEIEVPELAAATGFAHVSLMDEAGQPVLVPDPSGFPVGSWRFQRGRARLWGLAPGRYRVEVRAGDGRAWRAVAEIAAGAGHLRLEGAGR